MVPNFIHSLQSYTELGMKQRIRESDHGPKDRVTLQITLTECNTKSLFSHLSKGHTIFSVLHTPSLVLCCIHEKHACYSTFPVVDMIWLAFIGLHHDHNYTTIPQTLVHNLEGHSYIPIEDIYIPSWIFFYTWLVLVCVAFRWGFRKVFFFLN
jgi:hypothetical protein